MSRLAPFGSPAAPSGLPKQLHPVRWLLRHYPLNTPRTALLDRLPDVPPAYGTFRIRGGLRICACYGADVVSKSLYWLGAFDPWVGAALGRLARPGDTVLDVGANIGATAIPLARRVGPEGRVLCFEPFPDHAAKLRANIRCNALTNVFVHEMAVSAAPGRLTISCPTYDHQGMARIVPQDFSDETKDIVADTLDAILEREGIGNVSVCKIDVEGHEASLLQGAHGVLERGSVRAFVFERSAGQDPAADEVVQLFLRHGYRVLQIHKRVIGIDASEYGVAGSRRAWGAPTPDFVALRRGSDAEQRWAGVS